MTLLSMHPMLVSVLCLFSPVGAHAQSIASTPESGYVDKNTGPVLSEQEVVDKALEYSRKLKSYNTNVQIAEFRYESSGLISNPELRIRGPVDTRHRRRLR